MSDEITKPVEEKIEVEVPQEMEPIVISEPVFSPPVRGELGEGTQVQGSLRSFDKERSNERTVPVREMLEAEGVSEPTPEVEVKGVRYL